MSPTPTDLSLDDALDCLSNARRRYTIEIVHRRGDELPLSDVAELVAAREYGVERDALTSAQRKCVYTGLYQAHMKKLTRTGAVQFDERAKLLAPAENTAFLAEVITHLHTRFSAPE